MQERKNVPLAPLTTLRLGGAASRLVRVESIEELDQIVKGCAVQAEALLVLGGGSNVVIGDAGFAGTVVRLGFEAITVKADPGTGRVLVRVGAGASWDGLVERAAIEGWSGVECLAGIPGSVGATPMQNVGAYGQDVSETIVEIRTFDRAFGELAWVAKDECGFSYRSSRFRGTNRYIIVEVVFALSVDRRSAPIRYAELARALGVTEGARAPLDVVRRTVVGLRRGKGMVLDPADPDTVSAGSFFTNPIVERATLAAVEAVAAPARVPSFPMDDGRVKLAAAWLIERSGFAKGMTRGRVGISTKHALALVNHGHATTEELVDLARAIRDGVRARFGVVLEPEPVFVGCSL
jgi:UDP-N-acetylmuramate dehydrogenase